MNNQYQHSHTTRILSSQSPGVIQAKRSEREVGYSQPGGKVEGKDNAVPPPTKINTQKCIPSMSFSNEDWNMQRKQYSGMLEPSLNPGLGSWSEHPAHLQRKPKLMVASYHRPDRVAEWYNPDNYYPRSDRSFIHSSIPKTGEQRPYGLPAPVPEHMDHQRALGAGRSYHTVDGMVHFTTIADPHLSEEKFRSSSPYIQEVPARRDPVPESRKVEVMNTDRVMMSPPPSPLDDRMRKHSLSESRGRNAMDPTELKKMEEANSYGPQMRAESGRRIPEKPKSCRCIYRCHLGDSESMVEPSEEKKPSQVAENVFGDQYMPTITKDMRKKILLELKKRTVKEALTPHTLHIVSKMLEAERMTQEDRDWVKISQKSDLEDAVAVDRPSPQGAEEDNDWDACDIDAVDQGWDDLS